ncbi:portal protein [Halodesulfovibrio marinisediminis]|uniref:Bacteriophage head to tail connecting protein n=1 Tax=Halodesulfovibrio marinisediminis DSM 17456 TaxID=1121457 RepID=A0A1N6IY32_9BACT|nr:portal protein [Halodesulfovibrio marinisediminis]SIO36776.1 Bacteriophage head to tail connecting protein [Halodesulfovibrio marinisediminis DSM 17456]
MSQSLLKAVRTTSAFLEAQKQDWEPAWRDVAHYIVPHKGTFGFSDSGSTSRFSKKIIDGTASRSIRILAAGMQSGLTSPAQPWFRLRLVDRDLMEYAPVRLWLDAVENRIYNELAHAGFYQAAHSMYSELAAFGSANMYMASDEKRPFSFSCLTCGEYAWASDRYGKIDTVLRRTKMTVRQVAALFGEEGLSATARRMLARDPYNMIEVGHLVCPREGKSIVVSGKSKPFFVGKKNMPWASITFEMGTDATTVLNESGFMEFPHLCGRWDVTGMDTYGYSPAMDVMPDVKMLQEMAKSQLLAVHKVVNPPMRVPAGYKQRLNLIPGAQNFVNSTQQDAVSPLYQINPDIQAVSYKIDDVRRGIREGFFNDLFLMFTGEGRSNITATEVLERSQEKMVMLGPVIERHQTEILDPLLARMLGVLQRSGRMPEAPPELDGRALEVEYVSVLAQAQKLAGSNAIRQLTEQVGRMATVAPSVLDKLDFDQCVDELASTAGVPARVLRSDEDVAARREAARAQATELQAPEQIEKMASAVSSVVGATKESPELLEMVGSVVGSGTDVKSQKLLKEALTFTGR